MDNSVAVPLPKNRHPKLIYRIHSELKGYIHNPDYNFWSQTRVYITADKSGMNIQDFGLHGTGASPSEDQVQLWKKIDERLFELIEMANLAIIDPQLDKWRSKFNRGGFLLSSIELYDPNSFLMSFADEKFCNRVNLWPIVRFTEWAITDSDWQP